ncbi:MAG: DUF4287 domain-containing protein [Gemmataceae bacterium]|nr:DUF4287 domain-containing protein [Gemmataceae bacterium]
MAKKKTDYHIHPLIAYCQAVIDNIPAKTGKTIAQWMAILKKSGKEANYRAFLKGEYNLGATTGAILADLALGKTKDYTNPKTYLSEASGYIEKMYQGKEALRPIHDALVDLVLSLGKDVRICPCQTIVPVYRDHVFAQIKPTTKTRVDFSLALKNSKKNPVKRLIDTGGLAKGDRLTHRFALVSIKEIDAEVKSWVQMAYDLNPPKE